MSPTLPMPPLLLYAQFANNVSPQNQIPKNYFIMYISTYKNHKIPANAFIYFTISPSYLFFVYIPNSQFPFIIKCSSVFNNQCIYINPFNVSLGLNAHNLYIYKPGTICKICTSLSVCVYLNISSLYTFISLMYILHNFKCISICKLCQHHPDHNAPIFSLMYI